MAKIIIPTPLRKFTGNQATIETNGFTVLESLQSLAETHPEIKKHLFDDAGQVRKFVRLYLGDEDIKALQNEQTAVQDNSVISIIPAIAGGIK